MTPGPIRGSRQRKDHIRFTLLLPFLSIASWVCFVAVPVTAGYLPLRDSQRPAHHWFVDHTGEKVSHLALWLNGIDVPANFVELPIDRLLPAWPDTWYPTGFTVFSWRATTFPFYALPFWWFAGLGIDALVGKRRLRWPVLLLGSVSCCIFVLFAVLSTNTKERSFDAPGVQLPIVVGTYLWAFLFAGFPAAWLFGPRASALPKAVVKPEGRSD